MGVVDLSSAAYWEDESIDVRLNPRRNYPTAGLIEFLREELSLKNAIVLATSGSSGEPKFAVLQKEAVLASARSVVNHLDLSSEDSWLAGLSDFHVGGIGMYARGHITGADVSEFAAETWQREGFLFVQALERTKASWTSLTPTHLFDLVSHTVRCPESVKGVLLGGGIIRPRLVEAALELGWPILASYGMTEACSQIATATSGETEWLPVLSEWETSVNGEGRLRIRGEALFSGYVVSTSDGWTMNPARDATGWFATGDRVDLRKGKLRFLGRMDDLVKVSGELVSISSVESRLNEILAKSGSVGAITTVSDARRGCELVAVVEGSHSAGHFEKELLDSIPGIERPGRVVVVETLPRTDLGKVDRASLRDWVTDC
ncbi:MAG: AMP-binding protein [Verrucomicrobiota bacterium]